MSNRIVTAKMGRSQLDGLIRANPKLSVVGAKRPGTAAGNRFSKYKTATNVQEFFWLGGTRADLKHDIAKGIVMIEGDTESSDDEEPTKTMRTVIFQETEPCAPSDTSDNEEKADEEEADSGDHDEGDVRRSSRVRKPPPQPAGHSPRRGVWPVAPMDALAATKVLKSHLKVDWKMDKHFHECNGSDERDMNEWKESFQKEIDGVVEPLCSAWEEGAKACDWRRRRWRKASGAQGFHADGRCRFLMRLLSINNVRSMIAIRNRDAAHAHARCGKHFSTQSLAEECTCTRHWH